MFTGIVDHCGQVQSITENKRDFRITIASQFDDLQLGESIAIDGACFTVTSFTQTHFTVDISPETMRVTKVGSYHEGSHVNLERSLRLMDRLGGHLVTGHIDGQCRVKSILFSDEFKEVTFGEIAENCRSYLVKKGSVAVNGVSLTINEVDKTSFKVMLIPHTLQKTNLGSLQLGDSINIEYDYLAKIVLNQTKSESL